MKKLLLLSTAALFVALGCGEKPSEPKMKDAKQVKPTKPETSTSVAPEN